MSCIFAMFAASKILRRVLFLARKREAVPQLHRGPVDLWRLGLYVQASSTAYGLSVAAVAAHSCCLTSQLSCLPHDYLHRVRRRLTVL